MRQPKIVLFSESIQFLNVTKKSLELYKLNIKECINSLSQVKKYTNSKNEIFIVQIPHQNKERSYDIINFFYEIKVNWICVGQDSNINFFAMTKGAMANIILKQKPTSTEYKVFIKSLITKINQSVEIANIINSKIKKVESNKSFNKIIAIGASTGGTEAVQSILTTLNQDIPPVLIVIHMPPGFTKMYSSRLNEICKMKVKEAEDGDILRYGVAYIAPGGHHMRVIKRNKNMYISCKKEEKVNGHMPSVDVLFESVAEYAPNVVATILTGMGNDGALGILNIRNKGGFTIGQDKESCVVYGMPKAANDIGGVLLQASLENIPKLIMENI
ncbi:CheB methylesterase domain-containing protein [[Clostridium] colinum]|uniref:CheB methylesterase domain-containing protein n=1 Tax=[Clostridium] colinum TaxID=36835 RepID=UPI002024E5BF|nr:CheB methylesterase domain-containing protein [[Clostridium] colinum]